MNLKLPILLLIFIVFSVTQARADSFIVPDGTTAPSPSTTATISAGTAIIPTPASDGTVPYNIVASKPPCPNSTCITEQTIFNAKHGYVSDSDVKTYITLLNVPDGTKPIECAPPTQTGLSVYTQTLPSDHMGGPGIFKYHDDAFCMNQGCVYFGMEGAERCE